ncbi:hypothetical protein UG55_103012 [Frankia sp. EI5c]|uniref:hypothetical protein n=1 Tax=Frankia sp. EI5c TaxID=683316 RepID=UPI0007C33CC8|nr:hypothetical protein [Frankia sp. EI5c]OAA24368.1 hypothetical protein UG55_103012 [Frankia sp. EI5c]
MALRARITGHLAPFLVPGERVQQAFPAQAGPSFAPGLLMILGSLPTLLVGHLFPDLYFLGFGVLVVCYAAALVILLVSVENRIVAVTDQGILVLAAGPFSPFTPKWQAPLARLPRQTALGPVRGLWGTSRLAGEKLRVSIVYRGEVAAANAAVAEAMV